MRAILMYHSVDDSGSLISMPPATFDAHVRWLASGRVKVLSVEDMLRHASTGEDAVAVTFDDAYRASAPAITRLREHDMPVSLFVPTHHVGGSNAWSSRSRAHVARLPVMGWDELGRLSDRGVEIGAHSRRHPSLPELTSSELDDELAGGREDLREKLGVHATQIAYPFGDVDAEVAARARLHYQIGLTTEFRGLVDADDSLLLPRIEMFYFNAPGSLEAWGTAAFRMRVGWCRLRRWGRSYLRKASALVQRRSGRERR